MAFYRAAIGGGGNSALNPLYADSVFTATVSANGSVSFVTSQKPKWIVVVRARNSRADRIVADVANKKLRDWVSYSTYDYANYDSDFDVHFPSITDTGFTWKSTSGNTTYNTFFVWYSDWPGRLTSYGVLMDYTFQALNVDKTYTDLEIGKTYTYVCVVNATRDCRIGSVTGGNFYEEQYASASSGSYTVNWIVPTSTSITIHHSSSSSGGVMKMLYS